MLVSEILSLRIFHVWKYFTLSIGSIIVRCGCLEILLEKDDCDKIGEFRCRIVKLIYEVDDQSNIDSSCLIYLLVN